MSKSDSGNGYSTSKPFAFTPDATGASPGQPTVEPGVARRANALSSLPASLAEACRRHPYRALGLASAFGIGIGVIFSARLLRMALATAASAGVVEIVRTFVMDHEVEVMPLDEGTDAPVARDALVS